MGNRKLDFILIDAANRTVERTGFDKWQDAAADLGLMSGEVDMGSLARGVSIIVYEYGLFDPKETSKYFSIGNRLFVGNAILFGTDERGENASIPLMISKPVDPAKALEDEDYVPGDYALVHPMVNKQQAIARLHFYNDWQEVEAAIVAGKVARPKIAVNEEVLWQWPEPQREI